MSNVISALAEGAKILLVTIALLMVLWFVPLAMGW